MYQRLIILLTIPVFCLIGMGNIANAAVRDGAEALRSQDIRLAQIAENMLLRNASLCTDHMPITGMILHSSDQYSRPSESAFANGRVAISITLPGGAATIAGVAANDGLAAISGVPLHALEPQEGTHLRELAFNLLAEIGGEETPLVLTLQRGDEAFDVTLETQLGCRALIEIWADDGEGAYSDGKNILIKYGTASELTDEELAAVLAHELAHLVLHHRRRLSSENVSKGLFGEFGRDRRLNRQIEIEADQLSVHLLHNAGYDPAIAAQLWQSDARRHLGGGLIRSRYYPSRRDRIAILEEEAQRLGPDAPSTSMAQHLLHLRDQPFTLENN